MENQYTIVYSFKFKDGKTRAFTLALDRKDLGLVMERPSAPPPWTLLSPNKCGNCPLNEQANTHCPIALNLAGIVEEFKNFISHEKVSVAVSVEERTYFKETTIQQGLSPLLGIIMTTSGCPIMEQLKPMVRFHLPFASLEDTIFRMVSMYLVAQYLRHRDNKPAEWKLDGLAKVYAAVGQVNRDFARRLRIAAQKDANVNALVNLDCFATMVPLAADETLNAIKPYFAAYLK